MIAFTFGLIAMAIVWFVTDYVEPTSAYRRGYRQALKDMADAERKEE